MKKSAIRLTAYVLLFSFTFMLAGYAVPGFAAPAGAKRYIFSTTNPGGSQEIMFNAMATWFNDHETAYTLDMVGSGGSLENTRRLAQKECDITMSYSYHLYEATLGTGSMQGIAPSADMRFMFLLYTSTFYFVTLEGSGIKTMADLAGKRVVKGASGSGTSDNSRRVLGALGITVRESEMGFSDGAKALQDGTVDALGVSGHPSAGVVELTNSKDVHFIQFSPEELKTITTACSYYQVGSLPANVYKGQANAVPCPIFNVYIACNDYMEEQAVYSACKQWFSEGGKAFLLATSSQFREMGYNKDDSVNLNIPYHPGAIKFWEERGYK